jgi:hypothetical protein
MDLPDYCSCENVAQGDLGLIEPDELVARVVCDPRHIYKKDGSIKPGVFPPSHIKEKGLSLMRPRHLSDAEQKMHADAIASHSEKDFAVGVIEGKAQLIRALEQADGTRSVCLFDDPVKDDTILPDNPAHALLIAAKEMGDEDIAEIRTRLLTEVFGDLRRFAA